MEGRGGGGWFVAYAPSPVALPAVTLERLAACLSTLSGRRWQIRASDWWGLTFFKTLEYSC